MDSPKKTKKKQTIILWGGISALVLSLVFGMWMSDPNRGKPTPLEVQRQKEKEVTKSYVAGSAGISDEETWIARSEKRFAAQEQQNKELMNSVTTLQEQIKSLSDELSKKGGASSSNNSSPAGTATEEATAEASPAFPNTGTELPLPPAPAPVAEPQSTPAQTASQPTGVLPPAPAPTNTGDNLGVNQNGGNQPVSSIQMVDLSDDTAQGDGNQPEKPKNIADYLPTGAFATAVLMSGMDAPTGGQAKTDPVPVLMRIMDVGQLPNYFKSNIDKCHVVGAGYGDISSERAKIRLETLTCVLVNGDIIETPIKGYIAGEDGKEGMRGRLVSKQGAMIAKAAMAGAASGLGEAITQSYQTQQTSVLGTTTTTDPNKIFQAGAAGGAGKALEKIADYYMARANETYPIIEVDANRIGEIILTGGSDLGKNIIGATRKKPE